MARPLRIEYPGAHYHIIQRGIEQRDIFTSDKDKKKFLLYLTLAYKGYGAVIHCYVLMKNHYHLILETPKGNLSKIMHFLNTSYAAYFNTKHRRAGPLYQGRYKAILVQHDEYLHSLSRYIHLNPVRAKIVEDPKDYEWSSYKYFISKDPISEGAELRFILSMFDKEMGKAKRLYKQFVLEGIGRKDEGLRNNTRKGFILGNEDFFKDIKERFIDPRHDSEIPVLEEIRREDEGERERYIREVVEEETGKNSKLSRKIMIYFTRGYTQKTLKEIALQYAKVGYTGISQICRRVEKARATNKKLARLLEKVEQRIKEKCVM